MIPELEQSQCVSIVLSDQQYLVLNKNNVLGLMWNTKTVPGNHNKPAYLKFSCSIHGARGYFWSDMWWYTNKPSYPSGQCKVHRYGSWHLVDPNDLQPQHRWRSPFKILIRFIVLEVLTHKQTIWAETMKHRASTLRQNEGCRFVTTRLLCVSRKGG